MKKNIGILIYGYLFIFLGIYGFAFILYKVFYVKELNRVSDVSIISLFIYLGQIFVGRNLLRRKNWARVFVIVFMIFALISMLYGMFTIPITKDKLVIFLLYYLTSICVFTYGIFYFSLRRIKEVFESVKAFGAKKTNRGTESIC